jgi:LAO/AO transport system kinase
MIETVGVGQAEVEVAGNADTTVVVVNPGWGDSVQAAKAGLLEIGDVFLVNKADRPGVADTIRDLAQMLELGGVQEWEPPIVTTVAATGEGVDEAWDAINAHRDYLENTGRLAAIREDRLVIEMENALLDGLRTRVNRTVPEQVRRELTGRVRRRDIDPWSAAALFLDAVGVPSE